MVLTVSQRGALTVCLATYAARPWPGPAEACAVPPPRGISDEGNGADAPAVAGAPLAAAPPATCSKNAPRAASSFQASAAASSSMENASLMVTRVNTRGAAAPRPRVETRSGRALFYTLFQKPGCPPKFATWQTYMPTHLKLMSNSCQTHVKLMSNSCQTHVKLMSHEMVNGFRKNVIQREIRRASRGCC